MVIFITIRSKLTINCDDFHCSTMLIWVAISLNLTVCLSSCSDSDGGYMDMNKEESAQYVAMKELSYADIEPAVYETPYTAPGDTYGILCINTASL